MSYARPLVMLPKLQQSTYRKHTLNKGLLQINGQESIGGGRGGGGGGAGNSKQGISSAQTGKTHKPFLQSNLPQPATTSNQPLPI